MFKRKIVFLIVLVFLVSIFVIPSISFAADCRGTAGCITGKVIRVTDGDTLVLNSGLKVRLSLVNAPEKGDIIGWKAATDFMRRNCLNSIATVDIDDKQKRGSYGRVVGVVYCGEMNINAALLQAGLAKVWMTYCKKSEFANDYWAKPCRTQIKKKTRK